MFLYKVLAEHLNRSGIHYQVAELKALDLLEYMLLEAVGMLPSLQGIPLKCLLRVGYTSNREIVENKKYSSCEFGLKATAFCRNKSLEFPIDYTGLFAAIGDAVVAKFPTSSIDSEHDYQNLFKTMVGVIVREDDLETAMKSSSFFLAASDLSKFDLSTLLLLIKKLNLYKIADDKISLIVDDLTKKINDYIFKQFDTTTIQNMQPLVQRKYENMLSLSEKEQQFTQFLTQLRHKLTEQVSKKISEEMHHSKQKNKTCFSLNLFFFHKQTNISDKLIDEIDELRDNLVESHYHLFTDPIIHISFENFLQTCKETIKQSKAACSKSHAKKFYKELEPIFNSMMQCTKEIGGLVTNMPAIAPVFSINWAEKQGNQVVLNAFESFLKPVETESISPSISH